jgi:hypothetical protein
MAGVTDDTAQEVQERFAGTGIHTWYGHTTRKYWAYVPHPDRLVEAETPEQLAEQISWARRGGLWW